MRKAVIALVVLLSVTGALFVPVKAESVEIPPEYEDEVTSLLRMIKQMSGSTELTNLGFSVKTGNILWSIKVEYLKTSFSGGTSTDFAYSCDIEIRGLHIKGLNNGANTDLEAQELVFDLEKYVSSGTARIEVNEDGKTQLSLYVPLHRLILNS